MRVLVLDAQQRSALAAVRSIGRAGHEVLSADDARETLAGASRYCIHQLQHPSAYEHPALFMDWFERECRMSNVAAALPMTEVTTDLLVRHRERWPQVLLPFASIEAIDALTDKVSLYRRAVDLGVPVPQSVVIERAEDVDMAVRTIGFPAILKPRRSRLWDGYRFVSTSVRRVENRDALSNALTLPEFGDSAFLYQRIVDGQGQGIFTLYRNNVPIVFFSHRRLREKPPAGGVSVLSESCPPDPKLLRYARQLLDSVDWHGVAMVEFKGPYLMEINARFWGSLQLAVDAGADFPRMLLDGSSPTEANNFSCREGVRLRWFLGDLDRLYLALKEADDAKAASREILRFFTPDFRHTRHETFRWTDPKPAAQELLNYFLAIADRVRQRRVLRDGTDGRADN